MVSWPSVGGGASTAQMFANRNLDKLLLNRNSSELLSVLMVGHASSRYIPQFRVGLWIRQIYMVAILHQIENVALLLQSPILL